MRLPPFRSRSSIVQAGAVQCKPVPAPPGPLSTLNRPPGRSLKCQIRTTGSASHRHRPGDRARPRHCGGAGRHRACARKRAAPLGSSADARPVRRSLRSAGRSSRFAIACRHQARARQRCAPGRLAPANSEDRSQGVRTSLSPSQERDERRDMRWSSQKANRLLARRRSPLPGRIATEVSLCDVAAGNLSVQGVDTSTRSHGRSDASWMNAR
jgi:hypothetical protein